MSVLRVGDAVVHVYRAPEQPATRYEDTSLPWRWATFPRYHGFKPGVVLRCFCCGQQHRAAFMVVQVYYDRMVAYCSRGWWGGCRRDML